MNCLPIEIIELILADCKLNFEDVLNVAATCNHLRDVVQNSCYIWKKKFEMKWPQFMKLFHDDFTDWYKEAQYIYDLSNRTHAILSTMSPRLYKKNEFSDCDFQEWVELMEESPRAYNYILFDLKTIITTHTPIKSINVVPVDTPGNKTLQYYTIRVLRFIRQLHLSKEFGNLMALPPKKQILEKGATFVAQWNQPNSNIEWKNIAVQLDDLAKEVRATLKIAHPDHPLHKVPQETLEKWKMENLDGNQWNVFECRQIIPCLTSVLYGENRFCVKEFVFCMAEQNIVNEDKGLRITLSIIYESVARRVGLKCDIKYPAHFLLRFTEGQGEVYAGTYFIDVFNNGNIVQLCKNSTGNKKKVVPPATLQQIMEHMADNLEAAYGPNITPNKSITCYRSALELRHLVSPNDLPTILRLARTYKLYNIDTTPLENYLRTHEFEEPEEVEDALLTLRNFDLHHKQNFCDILTQPQAKIRPVNLKFAVGMVMKHMLLDYICVIYDWDPICMASPAWQTQMGVHRLENKDQQPFYNVLVEDQTDRYVAQENMIPTSNIGFLYLNEDLGKHFSHVFETHYVPNAEKEKEFPADTAIRHKFYQNMQFGI